jgi:hypothetical protein
MWTRFWVGFAEGVGLLMDAVPHSVEEWGQLAAILFLSALIVAVIATFLPKN